MVPSSFMISQITPEGSSPASAKDRLTPPSGRPAPVAALFGPQREDVPGARKVVRPRLGIHRRQNRPCPVGGGDTRRDAHPGIDRLAKRRPEIRSIVRRHERQSQGVASLRCQRQADQSPTVSRHKINDFGRDLLGCEGEVAFVFAVFVVDDDQHAPGARLFKGFRDGREWHKQEVPI